MMIILADKENDYLVLLQKKLSILIPGIAITPCTHLDAILASNNNPDSNMLNIYNSADFAELPQHFGGVECRNRDFWPYDPGVAREESPQQLFRIGTVNLLAERIRKWLPLHNGSDSVSDSCSGLHFLFCAEPAGYRPDISRNRLSKLMKGGNSVIYLPLMPTYQMSCLSDPGHGSSLSDLLLQLLANNTDVEQLGHFLQPHPDGYLQFRPPDRSDDLLTCSAAVLRQLIVLLRDYFNLSAERVSVLVDCASLPLASLSAVAVLCDSCEILLPERDCYATDAARREIGYLLAELPPGCKVLTT